MPAPPLFGDLDYKQALQRLSPSGRVWRRDQDSTFAALLGALAPTYTRSTEAGAQLLIDLFPESTINLLPEWEKSLGLPDACAPPDASLAVRQAAVRAKWGERGGQSISYFTAYAAKLGYPITITTFAPSRFGQAFGLRFGGQAWAHAWQVNAPTFTIRRFAFGHDFFGEPFASWDNSVLQCEIQRLAPAHTVILFKYS
jgi:uncharacterized protein YmfQ (DUF2313 family)